jgi:membrane fusion protein (multidrug efflux system)
MVTETEMLIQRMDKIKVTSTLGILMMAIKKYCGKQNSAARKAAATLPDVGVVTIQTQRVALTTELPGRTAAHLIAQVLNE